MGNMPTHFDEDACVYPMSGYSGHVPRGAVKRATNRGPSMTKKTVAMEILRTGERPMLNTWQDLHPSHLPERSLSRSSSSPALSTTSSEKYAKHFVPASEAPSGYGGHKPMFWCP